MAKLPGIQGNYVSDSAAVAFRFGRRRDLWRFVKELDLQELAHVHFPPVQALPLEAVLTSGPRGTPLPEHSRSVLDLLFTLRAGLSEGCDDLYCPAVMFFDAHQTTDNVVVFRSVDVVVSAGVLGVLAQHGGTPVATKII